MARARVSANSGQVLGRDCPNCRELIDAEAVYCPKCGRSIAEVETENRARKQEAAFKAEMEALQEAERKAHLAALEPIAQLAKSASHLMVWGWVCQSLPPYTSWIAWILWPIAVSRANKAQAMPLVAGDEPYRKRARSAAKWSRIGIVIWAVLLVIGILVFAWLVVIQPLTYHC
jgi:hypothetical protein